MCIRDRRWPLTWRLVAVLVVLLLTALALTALVSQAVLRTYLYDRTVEDLRAASQAAAEYDAADLGRSSHVSTAGIPSTYSVVYMEPNGVAFRIEQSPYETLLPAVPRLAINDPAVVGRQTLRVGSVALDGTPSANPQWLVSAGPLSGGSGTYLSLIHI